MFRSRKKKRGFFRTPTREERKTRPSRLRRFLRVMKWLAVVAIVCGIALSYHFKRLDRLIEAKFDRPRKWDLPSRVYSDAWYIYPGLGTEARGIAAKLDRLGYRNIGLPTRHAGEAGGGEAGRPVSGPGEYQATDNTIEIFLHDFEYPGELFKGFPVRITLEGDTALRQAQGAVASITRLDENEEIDLVRLEPEEIASIFTEAMEDRTPVTLADVPRSLIEAILLIEDERFFKHKGIDHLGILRAAIVNLGSMRIVQGGSTLTQQLVKNFFLYPRRSFVRKINEMLIALRIEKHHTKGEILEAYLNEIYLGQRGASSVSGVQEASRLYFGKDAGQLTLGESALLAGMIRSPNEYNPITKPEKAKDRRSFVLKRMFEKGLISKDDYSEAIAERIITPKPKVAVSGAPYFVDFVKRQLADLYPQEVLETEGLRIFTTLDFSSQLAAEKALLEGLANIEKSYAALLPKDHPEPLQACLIATQPSTGYVRALVGGRNYAESQFDRCTQAMRQPGSTFKPFVYLTALDPRRSGKSFTPASIIEDTSFEIESGGKMWSPKNYDKKEHGPVTLVTALEQSLNIATSRLAIAAGLSNVVATARDAGISSPLDPVPSIALGAFEVTPVEMASAYTIFPNGGIRAQPLAIINVVTKEGEILEKKTLHMKRTFDAAPIFITTTMMKGVIDRGTGRGVRALGFTDIAAGKTGTTSSYRDAWFVGFTPEILALVWVGYDDNAEIKMSGAKAALPMWASFMEDVVPKSERDFPGPSGVILVRIDPRTGGLTSNACPVGVPEAFIEGTEPRFTCEETSYPQAATNLTYPSERPKPSPRTTKHRRVEF